MSKVTFACFSGFVLLDRMIRGKRMKKAFLCIGFSLLALLLYAQHDHQHQDQSAAEDDLTAAAQARSQGHHHEGDDHMGAHMHMRTLRDPQPGDQEKAQQVVDQARQALEKYRDSNAALADGYKIFLPNIPQKMYHFTSWQSAMGAAFVFDPAKPTSLLYEKHGTNYKLIGAMYTAPVPFSEDQLNGRIPLSMAQWHQHVNMCKAPKGREIEMVTTNSKFGLQGSIATREESEAAGGALTAPSLGWMGPMYPWGKTPADIGAIEPQLS